MRNFGRRDGAAACAGGRADGGETASTRLHMRPRVGAVARLDEEANGRARVLVVPLALGGCGSPRQHARTRRHAGGERTNHVIHALCVVLARVQLAQRLRRLGRRLLVAHHGEGERNLGRAASGQGGRAGTEPRGRRAPTAAEAATHVRHVARPQAGGVLLRVLGELRAVARGGDGGLGRGSSAGVPRQLLRAATRPPRAPARRRSSPPWSASPWAGAPRATPSPCSSSPRTRRCRLPSRSAPRWPCCGTARRRWAPWRRAPARRWRGGRRRRGRRGSRGAPRGARSRAATATGRRSAYWRVAVTEVNLRRREDEKCGGH